MEAKDPAEDLEASDLEQKARLAWAAGGPRAKVTEAEAREALIRCPVEYR